MASTKLVWTCESLVLTLTAAAVGPAVQSVIRLETALNAKVDRTSQNYTLLRSYVKGTYTWPNTAAGTPIWVGYTMALVRAIRLMDGGDFGDIAAHNGDILLFDCRPLREPSISNDMLVPANAGWNTGSNVDLESKAQRKLARENDSIFLVGQKDQATEQDVLLRVAITLLWGRSA